LEREDSLPKESFTRNAFSRMDIKRHSRGHSLLQEIRHPADETSRTNEIMG